MPVGPLAIFTGRIIIIGLLSVSQEFLMIFFFFLRTFEIRS